jgi:hypothetical protein
METIDSWMVRHHDKVEHGPFTLVALIDAARRGNFAEDTEVMNPRHTRGQWILATRVKQIREAMEAFEASKPPVAPQNPVDSQVEAAAESSIVVEQSRTTRSRRSPVPEDLVSALLAFFDFRFRYFVTPWIVRGLYALFVAIMFLLAALFCMGLLADGAATGMKAVFGSNPVSPRPQTPYGGFEIDSPDSFESSSDSFSVTELLGSVMSVSVLFLSLFVFPLLSVRVICEAVILFFRIAEDTGDIRKLANEFQRNTRF